MSERRRRGRRAIRRPKRQTEDGAHLAGEAALLLDVAADDEAARRRRASTGTRDGEALGRACESAHSGRRRPGRRRRMTSGRQPAQIAGELGARCIGEVDRARAARLAARLDSAHQRRHAAGCASACSRLGLGVQRRQHLAGQDAVGLPQQHADDQMPGEDEIGGDGDGASARKAVVETRAGEAIRQGHRGSCSRPRARCAEAACRSFCRSWRAAARRARR